MIKKLILVLFIFLWASVGWAGTSYYCDLSNPGVDSGSAGSFADPFVSVLEVNNTSFSTGDDIYFLRSVHYDVASDNDTLLIDWAGTSGDRAIVGCYWSDGGSPNTDCGATPWVDGNRPVFDGNSTYPTQPSPPPEEAEYGLIRVVTDLDYITFRELKILQGNGYGFQTKYADYVIFDNLYISQNETISYLLTQSSHSIVQYSYAEYQGWPDYGQYGGSIVISGNNAAVGESAGFYNTVKYNKVFFSRNEGINLSRRTTYNTVEYNIVADARTPMRYLDESSYNHIRYNLVYTTSAHTSLASFGGYGIAIEVESPRNTCFSGYNEIYGNMIAGMSGDGLGLGIGLLCEWKKNDSGCDCHVGTKVYNNTIIDTDTNIRIPTYSPGGLAVTSDDSVEIKNNISYHTNSTGQLHLTNGIDSIDGVTWANNSFNNTDDTVTGNAAASNIGTSAPGISKTSSFIGLSLSTWDAAGDYGRDWFKLTSGSFVVDKGTDLGGSPYYLDYWGTNKDTNTPWDVGAHEWDGGAHYVDCTDSGSNEDGTFAEPFNTLAQVNAHSYANGDDIYFLVGTTCSPGPNDRLNITWDGVSSSNKIIIGAYQADGTLSLGSYDRPIIDGNHAAPPNNGTGYPAETPLVGGVGVDYLTVRDLDVYRSNGYGIHCKECTDVLFDNNYTRYTARIGIGISKTSSSTISNNNIDHAYWNSYVDFGRTIGDGLDVSALGGEGLASYNTVTGNVVSNCNEGIGIYQKASYNTVEYNVVYDSDYSIYSGAGKYNTIRYNLVYTSGTPDNAKGRGISFDNEAQRNYCYTGYNYVYGNLVANMTRGIFISNACGYNAGAEPYPNCDTSCNTNGMLVYNNTFVGNDYNIYIARDDAGWTGNIIENNISRLYTAGDYHVYPTSGSPQGFTWTTNNFYATGGPPAPSGNALASNVSGDPLLSTSTWTNLSEDGVDGTEFKPSSASGAGIGEATDIAGTDYDYRITASDYTAAPIEVTATLVTSGWDIGAWDYDFVGEPSGDTSSLTGGSCTGCTMQ